MISCRFGIWASRPVCKDQRTASVVVDISFAVVQVWQVTLAPHLVEVDARYHGFVLEMDAVHRDFACVDSCP